MEIIIILEKVFFIEIKAMRLFKVNNLFHLLSLYLLMIFQMLNHRSRTTKLIQSNNKIKIFNRTTRLIKINLLIKIINKMNIIHKLKTKIK